MGLEIKRRCFKNEGTFKTILDKAQEIVGEDEIISFNTFVSAATDLLLQGELGPKRVAVTPADNRPRNNDGTFLSAQQVAEKAFAEWAGAATTSMRDIRARAQSDSAFGKWFSEQNRLRLQEETKDAITPAGHVAEDDRIPASSDLRNFANDYNQAPSASLSPKQGFINMAGKKYSIARFQELVDLCSKANLL